MRLNFCKRLDTVVLNCMALSKLLLCLLRLRSMMYMANRSKRLPPVPIPLSNHQSADR